MAYPDPNIFFGAVGEFVNGAITIDTLRDRLIPAVYEYDNPSDWPSQRFVYFLIARFAEDDDGMWSEQALREFLRAAIEQEWPEVYRTLTTQIFSIDYASSSNGQGSAGNEVNPSLFQQLKKAGLRLTSSGRSRMIPAGN
jgi:hypothetical protein